MPKGDVTFALSFVIIVGMRYELRQRDPLLFFFLFAMVTPLALFFVHDGFDIVLLPVFPAFGALLFLSFEAARRLRTYLILHPSHLDLRQVGWGPYWGLNRPYAERTRIPYSIIRDVSTNSKGEVALALDLEPDFDDDEAVLSFEPREPRIVASEILSRVRASKAAPSMTAWNAPPAPLR